MRKIKKYHNIIKIICFVSLWLLPYTFGFIVNPIKKKEKYQIELALIKLKQFEGLRLNVYEFPKGCYVIGYGHRLKKSEIFRNITIKQADSLLISDLNTNIKIIETNTKYRGNKALALALLSFNIGHNKVLKSSLLNEINSNGNIGKTWFSYCKYKNKGKIIISKHLKTRRLFEYWLFSNNQKT